MSKLTIAIPCYNQTVLFKKELEYLKKQTFTHFDIFIIDDKSNENYQEIIPKFPNFRILYVRNEKNLGGMRNIFKSIFYNTDSPYIISLHEDDNLHPQYLEKAIKILENNKDVVFVITLAEWFKNNEELEMKFANRKDISKLVILDRTDFVRAILDGKHLMWGSVVYRKSMLDSKFNMEGYLNKYDILCDRPFLVSLIKDDLKVAIIEDRGMFVKDHWENDNRATNMTEEHCFNMMNFYRDCLPKPISKDDYRKFMVFSTNNLINTYSTINNKMIGFVQFIKKGRGLNLINFKYINKIGIVGILKVIFGTKIINKLVVILKKFYI